MVNREKLLAFFREKTRRPMRFKEIVSAMGLSSSESRALKRILRGMLRSGEIVLTKKGHYGPSEDMDLVTGYFEAHREGYGFVVPEKPGERDLFVPARAAMSAMDGDMVVVRTENRAKRLGRIVRILDRAHTRVAGRVEISKEGFYVRPKSRSIPFVIYIPPGKRGGAKDGQTVVVEITEYSVGLRPAAGKVMKIIREADEPKAVVEAIIEEFSLPRRFPSRVRTEAKSLYGTKDFGKRRDLRKLNTVTIDGERAKDFDDAVSVELSEHGYTLWVHIADVGFYLGWDTPLDIEARKRATSVYFPDRVIPMLPKELSEDLCSLRPKVDRPAFTVEMDFDRTGNRLDARFYPSLIKSDERMTYTSVRKILVDEDPKERKKYDYLLHDFDLMGELTSVLRQKRIDRGSLDFDLPEPEILLDLQGRPEAILRAERNFAHLMIEEFMIAANEAVAEHLSKLGVPSLYRIHEEPDPGRVEEVMKFAGGYARVGKKPGPKSYHKVLRAVRGRPEEEAITYMVLRSLKQARYSPENVGHFGLASECYTHFTSPIRRYPDLVVHRILREVLKRKQLSDKRIKELERVLPEISLNSSRRERTADESERQVTGAMRAWFMKDKVGDEFEARVVGVTPYGIRIRLNDYYIDGTVRVSNMTDDYYRYDESTLTLKGRHTKKAFKIGQKLGVRLDSVDLEEREMMFGLL
jgi:ribonuclease R